MRLLANWGLSRAIRSNTWAMWAPRLTWLRSLRKISISFNDSEELAYPENKGIYYKYFTVILKVSWTIPSNPFWDNGIIDTNLWHFPNANLRVELQAQYPFCRPCWWCGLKTKMPPLYSILDSWLVVLTILKNISQWEGLSHILWKIKNVWNHQPDMHLVHYPNHIHPIIFIHIPIVPSYSHHFPSCPWNIYQCSIFV